MGYAPRTILVSIFILWRVYYTIFLFPRINRANCLFIITSWLCDYFSGSYLARQSGTRRFPKWFGYKFAHADNGICFHCHSRKIFIKVIPSFFGRVDIVSGFFFDVVDANHTITLAHYYEKSREKIIGDYIVDSPLCFFK